MRRVEDIRTEDFIQSALRSQLFELREATVVRIDWSGCPSLVTLTFSYDTHHAKVGSPICTHIRLIIDQCFRWTCRCSRVIQCLFTDRAGPPAIHSCRCSCTSSNASNCKWATYVCRWCQTSSPPHHVCLSRRRHRRVRLLLCPRPWKCQCRWVLRLPEAMDFRRLSIRTRCTPKWPVLWPCTPST